MNRENTPENLRIVTIDGPAGAGKGTGAPAIAKDLGFIPLDTGAAYRTIAYLIQKAPKLDELLRDSHMREQHLAMLKTLDLHYDEEGTLLLCGETVESKIRTKEIGSLVPTISPIPVIRDYVHFLLRNAAIIASNAGKGVVAEGRDMGTTVFPDAPVKFYFWTEPEVRATRRLKQLLAQGQETTYEEVLADIIERDRKDMEREIDPLRPAEDAIHVDTGRFGELDYVQATQSHYRKAMEATTRQPLAAAQR